MNMFRKGYKVSKFEHVQGSGPHVGGRRGRGAGQTGLGGGFQVNKFEQVHSDHISHSFVNRQTHLNITFLQLPWQAVMTVDFPYNTTKNGRH